MPRRIPPTKMVSHRGKNNHARTFKTLGKKTSIRQAVSRNLHRNDNEGNALAKESSLQGEDCEVVEEAGQAGLSREDKLAAKEHSFGESRDDASCQLVSGFDDIVAQGGDGFGVIALGLHIAHIARGFFRNVRLKVIDLL